MKKKPQKKIPGPKPDTLKIKGDWQKAIEKSLEAQKPEGGWPK